MRWWMAGRFHMLHDNESRAWIVCPYCKDTHECGSVHDFCRHYADVHSDREGLLSVKLLQWRTLEWRDEYIRKQAKERGESVLWSGILRTNRTYAAYRGFGL
jgi:hypothetical protein